MTIRCPYSKQGMGDFSRRFGDSDEYKQAWHRASRMSFWTAFYAFLVRNHEVDCI